MIGLIRDSSERPKYSLGDGGTMVAAGQGEDPFLNFGRETKQTHDLCHPGPCDPLLASDFGLTLSYMHAFDKSVTGPSATALIGIGGTETLKMYQNSFGVAYGWKM